MKLEILLIVGLLFVANSFSQVEVVNTETISAVSKKNPSGTFIANKSFTKTLLTKDFNANKDLNVIKNELSFTWIISNKKNKCNSCDDFYATILPQWHQNDFVPSQVVMRYTIRPSTNFIVLKYNYSIENAYDNNQLLLKLLEVSSNKEMLIAKHFKNIETNEIIKTIEVVPGRTYYIDVIADYNSKKYDTSFSIDKINVIENIKVGTMVLSNSHNITYVN